MACTYVCMYANVSDQFGRVRILRDAVIFRRDRNAAINPSSNNSDIQLIKRVKNFLSATSRLRNLSRTHCQIADIDRNRERGVKCVDRNFSDRCLFTSRRIRDIFTRKRLDSHPAISRDKCHIRTTGFSLRDKSCDISPERIEESV